MPAASPVIFWLFKFAPPFKLLKPVTVWVPVTVLFPVTALLPFTCKPVDVTVPAKFGLSAISTLNVLPLTVVFTFVFELVPDARPPVILSVLPNLFVEVPVFPAKVIGLTTSAFKFDNAAPTFVAAV